MVAARTSTNPLEAERATHGWLAVLQRPSVAIGLRLGAVALLGLLAFRLSRLWRSNTIDFSAANVWVVLLALAATFVAVVGYGLVWSRILALIGTTPPPRSTLIFLQSQLGKYVPGSVWQYAGRVALARNRGIPVPATVLSLAVEVGASAIAAAALALFVLPVRVAAPLALALLVAVTLIGSTRSIQRVFDPALRFVARVVRINIPDRRPIYRGLSRATFLYVPVWTLYGLAFWLTARALFPVPAEDVVYFVGVFALAWLVGMAAVFAPGGIGVREAVLVGFLAPRLGEREAFVVAAASRLFLTASDLVGGGAALLIPRQRRTRPPLPLSRAEREQS